LRALRKGKPQETQAQAIAFEWKPGLTELNAGFAVNPRATGQDWTFIHFYLAG